MLFSPFFVIKSKVDFSQKSSHYEVQGWLILPQKSHYLPALILFYPTFPI